MSANATQLSSQMMSDAKFFMGYSRWSDEHGRYETWEESVKRVMDMHRAKYAHCMTPQLAELIDEAEEAYAEKLVLGSQRALQFGGPQIFAHEARLYNCSFSYVDRPRFFQETMYLLLTGCGVGFSAQKHHVAKLPEVARVSEQTKIFTIPDSIEGWADAFGVLLSSYFVKDQPFPEYEGYKVVFDYTKIRPRGAFISGGFKAPGPDGLARSLEKCRELMERLVSTEIQTQITPIYAYDFVMHMADAVLSGGIRRAATICIFSKDDEQMMNAKTGNWFIDNPQRARSNNSVMVVRDQITREEWSEIMKSVRDFGEPGFIFAEDSEFGFNPCVEIGLRAYTEDGRSGFQFCNLTEISGGACVDRLSFLRACRASAILGTLQAGYTNFTYLTPESREITEREALLGCSITGWMTNPTVLFDTDNMVDGSELVRNTNEMMAELIGIRPAARTTTVKPSGNASVLLRCASGIHGDHAPRYMRRVFMSDQDAVTQKIMATNPKMVEKAISSANPHDVVVSFPIEASEDSIFKRDLYGVKQLEYVRRAQQYWVNGGTNLEHCIDQRLRHNVSNTISVDNWEEVEEYIYENRAHFAGISLLSSTGDRDYVQAPFCEVLTAEQLVEQYGSGAILASGLIVDGAHAFGNNLWLACDTALGRGLVLNEEGSEDLLKRDWVRRAHKFAKRYFDGDLTKMTYCLKDCSNLHSWESIVGNLRYVEFAEELDQQKYTEVDSMGAQGCSGGACELTF